MMEALWLAGLLFANFWEASGLGDLSITDQVPPPPAVIQAMEQMPAARLVACWDSRIRFVKDTANGGVELPGVTGSVYLFGEATGKTIDAAGHIEVRAFDMAPAVRGEKPRLLAEWTFGTETLKTRKRKDLIGEGYTLFLPWISDDDVKNVKLQMFYVPENGTSCYGEPTYLALRTADVGVAQALHTEEPPRLVPAQIVSNERPIVMKPAADSPVLSVADVVTLSKAGVSKEVILRQMETVKRLSVIRAMVKADEADELAAMLKQMGAIPLTIDDLIEITKQGVHEEVIRAMQDRILEALRQWHSD
jgi:hypothetical protein